MGSLLFSPTPIGLLPRACNISCPAARDKQDERGRRRTRFSLFALFHVTSGEDGRGDWGVVDIAICLDVWMHQLSGWSGWLWQSICQDFLVGTSEMIAQQRMSSGQ